MTNIEQGSVPPPTPDPLVFQAPVSTEKLGDNVAKLESDLAKEREERAEERFLWIAAVAVLFNFIGYALIKDVLAFIPIFVLELILLTVVARRLGVDWAVQLLGALMHSLSKKLGGGKNDPPAA